MKKQTFIIAIVSIALGLLLFSCDGELSKASYKVSLDFNNGDEVLETDVLEGLDFTIPKIVPVKENYQFEHWICNGKKYNPGDKILVNSNITITAVWKEKDPNENNVCATFVLDGTTIKEQSVEKGKTVAAPTEGYTISEGYMLDGWYLNGTKYDFTTAVNSNITLTASIKKIKFIVTYDYNNGSENTTESVEWGSTVAKPTTPTSEGKSFGAWYLEDTVYDFSSPVRKDLTLKASWINAGKVNVVIKYGNGAEDKIEEYSEGVKYNLPGTPVYEGHTFLGWNINDSTTNATAGAEINLDSSKIITAKWEINKFKVTFNTGNGTAVADRIVNWGETLTDISTTQNDYDFVGWKNGTEAFDLATPIKQDLNLTAEWKIKTFTVKFMDGTTELESKTVDINTTVSAIEKPTKEGYTFIGWMNGNETYNFSSPVTTNLCLTTSWTVSTYEIKFETGVETTIESQNVEYGKKVVEPVIDSLTKTGCYFDGWLNGTEKYDFNSTVDSPLTLKANWIRNKYIVTFKEVPNGYDFNYSTAEVYHGDTVSAPEANPTNSGYTFSKWLKNGVEYNFNTPVTENITLTADWTKNKVKVTFKTGNTVFETKEVYIGTVVTKPETQPESSTSQKFTFWSTDNKNPYNFSSKVYDDITLTAVFINEDEYTVTFNYDDKDTVNKIEIYENNKSLTLPNKDRDGYKLSKWKDSYGNEYKVGDSYTVTNSVTFTAVWEQVVNIHFNPNNGELSTTKVVAVGETVQKPTDPTRENSTFIGWYYHGDHLFDLTNAVTAGDSDIYLEAKYSPEYYTVTFNPNNGEEKINKQVHWGDTIDIEQDPPKRRIYIRWLVCG